MTISTAIHSGVCASLGSLFGKLSGIEFSMITDPTLKYAVKIIFFCLMVSLNSLAWSIFVKALRSSKTAIEATAVSSATNYILSGILGFIAFGEVTGLLWWFGISVVVTGIFVISGPPLSSKSEKDEKRKKEKQY